MTEVNLATANFNVTTEHDNSTRPTIRSAAFRDAFESNEEQSDAFVDHAFFCENESDDFRSEANGENSHSGSRALSSALVAGILANHNSTNPEEELARLLEDDAISIFMQSAKTYAQHVGISEQDAMSEILGKVSRLEMLWKEVLQRKGVDSLESESNR